MSKIDQQFAHSMCELRRELGLSQAGLADALRERGHDLDPTAVCRMEKHVGGLPGARVIRLAEAVAIADVLGSTIADMLALAASQKERRIAALRAELEVLEGDA